MSKVILTEGINDTEFLEASISEYANQLEVDRYDIESQPADATVPEESEKLRSFGGRFCPYDVLLKSEGGIPNLKRCFADLTRYFTTYDPEIYLLVDLDSRTVSDIISDINDILRGKNTSRSIKIEPNSRIERLTYIHKQVHNIHIDGSPSKNFTLIAFPSDLEDIAGIGEDDSRESKNEKLVELAGDERVRKPITRAIF
ncbi:hypothetical protein Hbl1158_13760 [Halobaculum sp. CBA1158]|uniref:hypothetical protein n=1 Tax=Halobaculum sp. CBA1158 TaxID=2904243 RepID=UPI001F1E5F4B|nr:hypothetical protein [Halobaculum sp. CBA1158]UIO99575.1 hypothetical protein Hbl1158_13760 [Halobaculum sp. CBA1158]